MQEIRFRISLSAQEYLAYYQGVARAVVVKSLDGRTVQFPASILRQFVAHDGVRGVFALRYDAHNKLVDVRRIAD